MESILYYEQEIARLKRLIRAKEAKLRIQCRNEVRLRAQRKNKFKIRRDYPNGTMLAFNKRFDRGPSHPYTYVALKVDGLWTYTGMDKHYHSWEDLVNFLSEGVDEVYLVTGITKL
jgi:hypothetical protein